MGLVLLQHIAGAIDSDTDDRRRDMPELSDNVLIFSDLDGSLLDHETYDWQAAAPWLRRLK